MAHAKSFILMCYFCTFHKFRNLTFLAFFSRFLTVVDLFYLKNAFFEKLISRASFWGIICPLLAMSEIWPHIPPNAPGWPQGFLSSYKKIFWQNWVFWRLIEKKIIMSWITLDFFKNKTNVLLRGVIFQVRDQISKKVAGQFEEH